MTLLLALRIALFASRITSYNVCYTKLLRLNEEEILLLSSGIVDAYLHKASIYALKYVEPYLQREAIPTYPPSEAVLQVIRKDPNIIDMAEHALTASIRAGLEGDLASVTSQRAAEFMSQKSSSTFVRTSQEENDSFVLDAGNVITSYSIHYTKLYEGGAAAGWA